MLSYNRETAANLVRDMQEYLAAQGLPTWVDYNNMGADLMESMADAVENAKAVCVFVTPAYKESANCRRECAYAIEQKKPIVWIMCNQEYKPNGWLGISMGTARWLPAWDDGLGPSIVGMVDQSKAKSSEAKPPLPPPSTPRVASPPTDSAVLKELKEMKVELKEVKEMLRVLIERGI